MSASCSGMSSAVSSPTTSAESAGSAKPGRSRSYQPGHGDQGEDGEHDRQRRDHRQHAAAPARDEEGEHDVEHDVDDLQRLGAHQLLPGADRDHRHHERGDEQEHDDDQARRLRGRLLAVGMLDLDAVGGHPRATLQSRACRRDRRPSPCGRGGTGRRARFRSSCRKAWGFESLRPHSDGGDHAPPGRHHARRGGRRDRQRREREPARRRRGRRRDPPRGRPGAARRVPRAGRLRDRRREDHRRRGPPRPARDPRGRPRLAGWRRRRAGAARRLPPQGDRARRRARLRDRRLPGDLDGRLWLPARRRPRASRSPRPARPSIAIRRSTEARFWLFDQRALDAFTAAAGAPPGSA